MLTNILIGVAVFLGSIAISEGIAIFQIKKKYDEVIDELIGQLNKQQLWKFRNKPNAQKSKGKRRN